MAIDPSVTLWPTMLMPERMARRRVHPVNTGPEPIATAPQTVSADAGRWQIGMSRIRLYGDDHILTFRALMAHICSPILPVYVPVADFLYTPRARAAVLQPTGVYFSDGSAFSDSTTFWDQPVDYIVTNAAAARARSIRVTAQGPSEIALTAGNYIGLGERLYVVTKIFDATDHVAGHYDLQVWPPLRESSVAGDPVWTEFPVLKCAVSTKSVEASEDLDCVGWGFVDVDFDEWRW